MPVWRTMYWDVTSGCNLRCKYCFRDFDKPFERVSLTAIDDTIAWLKEHASPKLKLVFFGGEPLLAYREIRKVIKRSPPDWQFTVTTNGLLLDKEKCKFFRKHNVSLLVSMDGAPISHNRFRVKANNEGSWSSTFSGLITALREGIYCEVAFTVLPETITDLMKGIHLCWSAGVRAVNLNRVDGWPTPWDQPLLREILWHAASWWWTHKDDRPGITIWPITKTMRELALNKRMQENRMPARAFARRSCGACHGSLGIDWKGLLYPCHRMLNEEHILGNTSTGITNHSKLIQIQKLEREECLRCPVFPCGSCHVVWDEQVCIWNKIRYEVCEKAVRELVWPAMQNNTRM